MEGSRGTPNVVSSLGSRGSSKGIISPKSTPYKRVNQFVKPVSITRVASYHETRESITPNQDETDRS